MNKQLKIAIYSGAIPTTTFIENLIEGIASSHIVLLFGKQIRKPKYSNKFIHCYPIYSNKFSNLLLTKWRVLLLMLMYPKRFLILWDQLKTKKGFYSKFNWLSRYVPVLLHLPDIFHVQWAKDLEHWMFLKEQNVKVVLSLRGAHINYSPIANKILADSYRKNFPNVDAFHAVSGAIRKEAQMYGADPKKIFKIHSLISQRTFDLFRTIEKKKDPVLKIISVGRHHWKKGYATALDACSVLKSKSISFKYTIIAGGNVPEELLIQRDQLNLKNEVHFMDLLPQDEMFNEMLANDILLLPSYEEGIANVVLEAMAMGLPVISSDCGGMKEVVIAGETGWLVSMLDSKKMARALINFKQSSSEELNIITLSAYNLVSKNFKKQINILDFNSFYAIKN